MPSEVPSCGRLQSGIVAWSETMPDGRLGVDDNEGSRNYKAFDQTTIDNDRSPIGLLNVKL